jgi:malate/lactate dehydrogenase
MLVAAIAAGIFAALVRAVQKQADTAFFVILVVAAPVGFMVLVSLWKALEDFLAARRNERDRRDDSI